MSHNFHDFGQSKKKLLPGPKTNVISGIALPLTNVGMRRRQQAYIFSAGGLAE
jgi:hypothetical protein